MKCHECRELLPAIVLGEETLDQRPDIREHLANCNDCQEELSRMQAILKALAEDAQSDHLSEVELLRLEKAVYQDLASGASTRQLTPWRSTNTLIRLAAALVLFALGYLSHSLLAKPQSEKTVMPVTQVAQTFASYDRGQYESLRFSAAGLKAIAQGRKAAVQQIDRMLEGTR